MKPSFVAACLAVSVKVISGAIVELEEVIVEENNFWEFADNQSFSEFRETVERKVKSDCPHLRANISSVGRLARKKLVWYIAKHYDTLWKADSSLLLDMNLSYFLRSILLADNLSFVEDLRVELFDQVMIPQNLIACDAVNLAKTQFDLARLFSDRTLEINNAVKIIELKRQRNDLGCDISLAIKTGDTNTLDRCIAAGVWTPTIDQLNHAVHDRSETFLLYLQEKIKKVPSARYINLLSRYNHFDVLENILSSHPDWKPCQSDIDDAARHQWVNALRVYASVDPSMPPTKVAVIDAITKKKWGTLEFFLEEWSFVFDEFKLEGRGVTQSDITWLTFYGYVKVLKWNAKAHPNAFLPSKTDLNNALKMKHFKVLEWRASIRPAWKVDPEQIKDAIARGDYDIVNWYDEYITARHDPNDENVNADVFG